MNSQEVIIENKINLDYENSSDTEEIEKQVLPFYSKEPELIINQEVMCYPTRLDKESGVYVSLPEFAGKEGFIPMAEISDSKRERRNPQKIVKIGKIFVARVYSIDDSSMITLSRRRLRKDDIVACEQRFKDALTMLKIVENMSQYTKLTRHDCHALIMWPLYKITEDPMDFIQNIIVKPEQINDLPIKDHHHALLIEVVIKTIGKANAVAQRNFEITIDDSRGVNIIQYAIGIAESVQPPKNVEQVEITYQGSHYLLSCKCPHPSIAESYLEQVQHSFIQALKEPVLSNYIPVKLYPDNIGLEYQPRLNIGFIGHVSHGKSTVCKAISGVKTQRHKSEQKQNCTIKLGYTNAKIWKTDTNEYISGPSKTIDSKNELVQHVSFVDCPGHDAFMTTMLGGSSLMDAAILVIAANEGPQAQTEEHLMVMDIIKMKRMLILLNKAELISPDKIAEKIQEIRQFVKGTVAENAPIIPISAHQKINIDQICKFITHLETDTTVIQNKPFMFTAVRSFDVNSPGTTKNNLKGAVLGGSILAGKIQVGEKVEIRPGKVEWSHSGEWKVHPYHTTVLALMSDKNYLNTAVSGGCIAIQTSMDPGLARGDRFVGQIMGQPGTLPEVYHEIELEIGLLRNKIGSSKIKLKEEDTVLLQILTYSVSANIVSIKKIRTDSEKKKVITFRLSKPVCTKIGDQIAISRNDRRLIGYGVMVDGKFIKINQNTSEKPLLKHQDVINEQECIETFASFMDNKEKRTKLSLPSPILVKDGGKRIRWTNVYTIMEKLGRPVESLQNFIVQESGQNVNLNYNDKVMILHGNFKQKQVGKLLFNYAKRVIQCKQCFSMNTVIQQIKSNEYMVCLDCKAEHCIK